MGLKEMQLMFDNAWAAYYPGSKVAGRLVLNLDSPKKVREIKIKFKGEARVKWTETEQRNNSEGKSETHYVDYTADETYFENKFTVVGECELPAGQHNFDFSTILPPNLPSSYEGEHGHIRYTVKAVLDRPWKFDQEAKAAFTVISHVDLNYSQEARMPLRQHKEKSVGFWCCSQGTLSGTLTAPYSGYTSGQTLPLSVEIDNGTNTNVSPGYVILRKVVTYKSRYPSQRTKIEKTEIARMALTQVGAHGTDLQNVPIVVPSLPATNTLGCSIISIIYEVKANLPVSATCLRGLEFSAPIIIGTVPIVAAMPPPTSGPAQGPGQIGWTNGGDMKSIYPDLPPPSYEESTFGRADTIKDKDDNEHTMGVGGWVPRYPSYNFTPSAPPPPLG